MLTSDFNNLFIKKGRTLGSIESFTGGGFANEIISISGASHFFKGSIVTYATEEKSRLLSISYGLIDKYGVVSEEVAREMAINGRKLLNVDYCLSFTGNAGPNCLENKPAGTIFIGISSYKNCHVFGFNLKGDRNQVRRNAIELAKEIAMNFLKEEK